MEKNDDWVNHNPYGVAQIVGTSFIKNRHTGEFEHYSIGYYYLENVLICYL